MNGLLVYSKADLKKNTDYISWLVNEAEEKNMNLEVTTDEDIQLKGIDSTELVDFVMNRSRSFEVSLLFELNNIRVFNNSTVTLVGNNKLAAYKYAQKKGFKFPKLFLNFSDKKQMLIKPNNGHGGEGIYLINRHETLPLTESLKQEFILDVIGDIRFYIINNAIVNAVIRSSDKKVVSNFSQGGDFKIYNYSKKEEKFIKDFMKGTTFDYVGIDFFLTKDRKLIFNEIEDVVGSRMLSYLGINNTTELYLEHIHKTIKRGKNTK